MIDKDKLVRSIDHTLLNPAATQSDIVKLCEEAIQWGFYSVCVNSYWLPLAKQLTRGTSVKVVTVAGFPLGCCSAAIKASEIDSAIMQGADEVDFVQNTGLIKQRSFDEVQADYATLLKAAQGIPLKVIIETALLSEEEKRVSCQLASQSGIAFVKTCTGFMGGSATVEDVALMRKAVEKHTSVKASAGIRDTKTALALLKAGAVRLGTSASVAIMLGSEAQSAAY